MQAAARFFAVTSGRVAVSNPSRAYAAAAAAAAPKKNLSSVESFRGKNGRTAKSLYVAASKLHQENDLREELNELKYVLQNSRQFRLGCHRLPTEEWLQGDITKVLVEYLKVNKAMDQLLPVCEAYEEGMRELNNENHVQLTVSQALDSAQQAALTKQLEEPGKKLVLDVSVDPAIGGGFIMRSSQREVDLSYRSLMNKLQEEFDIRMQNKVELELSEVRKALDVELRGASSNEKFLSEVNAKVQELSKQIGM